MESRRARKAARPAIHAMREGARVFENERVVQMVKFWTVRQEELIREYGHLGAEAVADAIFAECGVRRTVRAVQQHAHVIHASLRVKPTCPECSAIGVPLNYQSGLCPTCNDKMRLAEAIAYNEVLLEEAERACDPELIAGLRREQAALRKKAERLRDEYGLPGKQERKRGLKGCLCPICKHVAGCKRCDL